MLSSAEDDDDDEVEVLCEGALAASRAALPPFLWAALVLAKVLREPSRITGARWQECCVV